MLSYIHQMTNGTHHAIVVCGNSQFSGSEVYIHNSPLYVLKSFSKAFVSVEIWSVGDVSTKELIVRRITIGTWMDCQSHWFSSD